MENKNKYNNPKNKSTVGSKGSSGAKQPFGKDKFGMSKQGGQSRNRVLSLTQLLSRIRKQRGGLPVVSNFVKNTNSLQANDFTFVSANNRLGNKRSEDQQAALLPGIGSNTLGGVNLSGTALKNNRVAALPLQRAAGSLLRNEPQKQDQRTRTQKDQMGISRGTQTRMEREEQKRQKPIKPIIPPKSLVIILKEKPEKILYNRRIIDYKHCGLLQRYIGLGGKILPRRQTRLTAKQQRYIAKTIKSARIMGLLPFVSKEKGFFR
nr:ribosomal protein S18 [Chlorococcum sp. KSF0227]